ncbi:TetR/AcrR family transcriptional regulator [Desulfoluna spongiiphila]|uniref:Transcriptional regulator, TetR family n=1 Tax=Desulfoluna spongiiphila TaxID=419481 RepID=A0A1G5GRW2_9BACT|nr:TetR/AcrR family transcriptional regulator [Desulfoluna spongiiphila]SCY54276.1 transcriptional regulator, TetR family [Desulfoluna spongiiphila]VVS92870.1 consensus disorder prediction [Desulfoluna spongiiphila]
MQENTDTPMQEKPSTVRRKREKAHRERTILDAALRLFVAKGFHRTSASEIANAAEVSVGTVYFYFKNKEALLIRLTEEISYELRKLVGSEFSLSDGTLDGFKGAGLSFFKDFCIPHPEKVTLLFREAVGHSQAVEKARKKGFTQLTEDVRKAILFMAENMDRPLTNPESADVLAVSIVGIYERVAYNYLFWKEGETDILKVGEDAVAFLVAGVERFLKP